MKQTPVPKRVASQGHLSAMAPKRVRLADPTVLSVSAMGHQAYDAPQPYDSTKRFDEVQVKALPAPGSTGPGMHGNDPKHQGLMGRRALLVAATAGCGTALWATSNREVLFPEESTAVANPTGLSVGEARLLCEESAATCSTVYSQMSSTLRMAHGGFMDQELFQQTCMRRLGSPYILESFSTLQDAVPVLGASLAYAPKPQHKSPLAALFTPASDTARTASYEALTLAAVQRCRRVARVLKFMAVQGYTPNGLELMLGDLRALMDDLDQVLAEVPATM